MRRHLYSQPIEIAQSIPDHPKAIRLDLPEPPNGDASDQAFIYRIDGKAVGFFNRCGHVRLPMDLDDGKFFDLEGMIICRVHGARFDENSGACVVGPAYTGLYRLLIESRPQSGQSAPEAESAIPAPGATPQLMGPSPGSRNTYPAAGAVTAEEVGSAGDEGPNTRGLCILGWEGPVVPE